MNDSNSYKEHAKKALEREAALNVEDHALIGKLAGENWNSVVTPLGIACELLRHYPEQFLIVDSQPQSRTLLAHKGGTWIDDMSIFQAALDRLGRSYIEAMDRIIARLDPKENKAQRAMYKEKIRLWRAATIKYAQIGSKLELEPRLAEALNYIESQPAHCHDSALDNNLEWIGASNGVIGLCTGQHIRDPSHARKKLVVGMLPDPFDWSAHSELMNRLFAHIDDSVRRYLLESIAWALRGNPSRVFMVLLGESGGGKSTLIAALQSALGIYTSTVNEDAFTRKRNTSGLAPSIENLIAPRRLAFLPEANKALYDPERLKAISGSDRITWRPLYRPERTDRVTATVMMVANHLPRFDGTDDALMERMRVLPYPSIPATDRDASMINAFVGNSEIAIVARQSLVVEIVKAGSKLTSPPAAPPFVRNATQDAMTDLIGEAGLWIRENVIQRKDGRLSTSGLWAAIRREFDADAKDKVVGGLTRQNAVRLVSGAHGKTQSVRDPRENNRIGRGWTHVGLTTDY